MIEPRTVVVPLPEVNILLSTVELRYETPTRMVRSALAVLRSVMVAVPVCGTVELPNVNEYPAG